MSFLKLYLVIPTALALAHSALGSPLQDSITHAFQERADDALLSGISVGMIKQNETFEMNLGDVHSSHDLFEIGSISKSFAGIIISKLSIEGKLDLEEPISTYIPELKGTYFETNKISAHLLATHSAGLIRSAPKNAYNNGEAGFVEYLKNYSSDGQYPVGKRVYSNLSFSVLSLLVKRITGQNYEDIIKSEIFTPLEMSETGFLDNRAVFSKLITPFNILHEITWNDLLLEFEAAMGGVFSNLSDMMKFLQANLHTDTQPGLKPALDRSHLLGLGWDSAPGADRTWKNGLMSGYSSVIEFEPKNNMGVIALNHNRNSSFTNIGNIAMGDKDPYKQDLTVDPSIKNNVVGTYSNIDENGNQLRIQIFITPDNFYAAESFDVTHQSLNFRARLRTFDQKTFWVFDGFSNSDKLDFTFSTDLNSSANLNYSTYQSTDANGQSTFKTTVFNKTE